MDTIVCKMIGIRRYSSLDLIYGRQPQHSQVLSITDKTAIKVNIADLINNQRYDSVLVNYMGELFVCEPNRNANTMYTKKALKYHPLETTVTI